MTSTDLIEIFCILDEFCKYFEPELRRHTLEPPGKRHRDRPYYLLFISHAMLYRFRALL